MTQERIQATTFDENELRAIIEDLGRRFSESAEAKGQPMASLRIHDRIASRRAHFFNLPEADPPLPEPWVRAGERRYQTDMLRQKHNELKARLCENHFVVETVPPRDTPTMRQMAERAEKVLNAGLLQLEQRRNLSLQGALSDGQIIDGYAVLHWRLASEIWPAMPEYEWQDVLPKDPQERKRFKPRKELVDPNGAADGPRKYRETDASLRDRYGVAKARAGFPWFVSAPDPASVLFVPDQGTAENPALLAHIEVVGLLDYSKALEGNSIKVSLNQIDGKVRVYTEEEAPPNWTPSGGMAWGAQVAIARVWTRDEYYELVADASGQQVAYGASWELVRSHKHPYERVPYVICPAFEVNNSDPALRYQPALAGMFAVKPFYDKKHALLDVLAESVAVPLYYLQSATSGLPMLDEDGSVMQLTADSALAQKVPDGYELKELRPEINQGYLLSVQATKEELADSAPATGIVEITASTKPWTARLQQSQANVEPVFLVNNQALAIEVMVRNMVKVMGKPVEDGGLGEGVTMYHGEDSKERTLETVEVDEWPEIDVTVKVNPVSSAERITLEEHGRELLNDPLVPLTRERFGDDYMGWEDTSERVAEWEAEQIYDESFRPAVRKYVTAEWAGSQFVMGPNGEDIGMGGQAVTPEQIGAANGIRAMQPPPPPMQPGAVPAPQPQGVGQTTMPVMPQLAAPGTAPMQGMQG